MLTKMGERSWVSNEGYPDALGSHYAYDSGVANHLRVKVGHLVVLRDTNYVYGVSRVDSLTRSEGTKVRFKCPKCGKADLSERKRDLPRYLCRAEGCRYEFDVPLKMGDPVDLYVAGYGAEWQALDGAVPAAELELLLDKSKQNAIRPCEVQGLKKLLARIHVTAPAMPKQQSNLVPPTGGHRAAMVRVRKGQAKFREQLLQRYGLVCAVTGPCPAKALEAAHLRAFAVHATHDPDEGLLLRSDIHSLFDAGLIAVEPVTMKVVIAPALNNYPSYVALKGISIADGTYAEALAEHYKEVVSTW
ncbi:HNH endonuclease [Nocardia asiatica]|uniref:HNH endonuclease n=1 Tax=Nocardia asiatica TaxID=209252 RepID=UPI0024543952|nr:HNH endonuclease [Nocardia asiatica]